MTIHEQTTLAEIVRAQVALLNDTIGLVKGVAPTTEHTDQLVKEILRLSALIK